MTTAIMTTVERSEKCKMVKKVMTVMNRPDNEAQVPTFQVCMHAHAHAHTHMMATWK
jgi:hypothetical protein